MIPKESLERLASRLTPEELTRRVRRRFVATRRPILHDQLAQVRALDRPDGGGLAGAARDRDLRVRGDLGTARCSSSRARS